MKLIIVEDQLSAMNVLKEILTTELQDVEVIGEANSIKLAKELIESLKPDLLLLDIELSDGTGIELLRQLGDFSLKVIFITAHEKYAIQAIKLSALDYLMKPVNPDELVGAVNKAMLELEKEFDSIRLKTLSNNQVEKGQHRMVLKDKNGFHLFNIEDIIRLEALGSYTQFIVKEAQPVLISKNLKEYDALLQPYGFFRCHRSHLVNLSYVQSYSRSEGEMLLLKNKSQVPLASRKKDLLLKALSESAHIN